MEYDEINITKIKDGIFLGDAATSNNLDIIIKFKITRMINTAGNEIINAWESIGIKYLTIKWTESSSQNLFDTKDEIANKIVKIIDDADKLGEGILIHSVRGRNRGCIKYFRYNWSLNKSLEFLKNKKGDVEIRKYFLDQLANFEERFKRNFNGRLSHDWSENKEYVDDDEMIIRNTYINGIVKREGLNKIRENNNRSFTAKAKKIKWAEGSRLINMNIVKDITFLKDFNQIASHKNRLAKKSCIKNRNKTKGIVPNEMKRSSSVVVTPLRKSDNLLYNRQEENFNKSIYNSNVDIIKNVENSYMQNKNQDFQNNSYKTNEKNSSTSIKTFDKKYSEKSLDDLKNSSTNLISNKDSKIDKMIDRFGNTEEEKIKTNNVNINQRNKLKDNPKDYQHSNQNLKLEYPTTEVYGKKNNYLGINSNNIKIEDNIPKRSSSLEKQSYKESSFTEKKDLIIASKYQNIINNNYNNIYVNSKDLERLTEIVENSYDLKSLKNKDRQNNFIKENAKKEKSPHFKDLNYDYNIHYPCERNKDTDKNYVSYENQTESISNVKQDNYSSSDFNYKQVRFQNQENSNKNAYNILSASTEKLIKSHENPKTLNNISNSYNFIEKNKENEYTNSKIIYKRHFNNEYNKETNQYDRNNVENHYDKLRNNSQNTHSYAVNNYQPELMNKLNNFNKTFSQINNTSQIHGADHRKGPIKINNEYEKKPSTPDTLVYSSNYNNRINSRDNDMRNRLYNHQLDLGDPIKKINEQSIENNRINRQYTPQQLERETRKMAAFNRDSYLRRIPSPLVKSTTSQLNDLSSSINVTKYRAPSPGYNNKSSQYTVTPTRVNLRDHNNLKLI